MLQSLHRSRTLPTSIASFGAHAITCSSPGHKRMYRFFPVYENMCLTSSPEEASEQDRRIWASSGTSIRSFSINDFLEKPELAPLVSKQHQLMSPAWVSDPQTHQKHWLNNLLLLGGTDVVVLLLLHCKSRFSHFIILIIVCVCVCMCVFHSMCR